MYAVFVDGSRQYRVSEDDVVRLDYRDAEVGTQLELKPVLLYATEAEGSEAQIGRPVLEGARVVAEVVGHPSTKLYIQHFRRRKNYRRLRGHRQPYTAVKVRHILLAGQEPKAPAPAPETAPPAQQPSAGTP
jgi:large subunit ribosomal protein L21